MQLSAIKRMEEISKGMTDVISLSQGIPSGFSDAIIRDSVIEAINSNKVDKYSQVAGISELREEISSHLLKQKCSLILNLRSLLQPVLCKALQLLFLHSLSLGMKLS